MTEDLKAEADRLRKIGDGWRDLHDEPADPTQPTTTKPKRRTGKRSAVAEARAAHYSAGRIEHATAHRGGPKAS